MVQQTHGWDDRGGAADPGCAVTSLCSLQVTDTAVAADDDDAAACDFILAKPIYDRNPI